MYIIRVPIWHLEDKRKRGQRYGSWKSRLFNEQLYELYVRH